MKDSGSKKKKMAPIIHCVRHGQGFHNVGGGHYNIPDPFLTQLGASQSESLRNGTFIDQSKISLIVSSPMCRTLQTASLVFQTALASTLISRKIIAFPDAQETSIDPCDIGSDPEILQYIVEKEKWPVDLSLVKDGWNQKKPRSRYSQSNDAIRARARDTRLFLRAKLRELISNGNDDAEIVLVTHGGFLHYLTDDWEDSYRYPGTGWYNCETRSYLFESSFKSDQDEEAWLVETKESRQRRGKYHSMCGKNDQVKLFTLAMERWQGQGLQIPDEVDLDFEVDNEKSPAEGDRATKREYHQDKTVETLIPHQQENPDSTVLTGFLSPIILDGGMSRELIRLGAPFRQPEWSALALIEAPQFVAQVHHDFATAGADILTTNSYALVPFHIGNDRFEKDGQKLAELAGTLARNAADQEHMRSKRRVLVAGCLPPVFGSYRPDLFDAARAGNYLEVLVQGLHPHIDVWLGETLSSIAEAKAIEKATSKTGKPLWIAFSLYDERMLNEPKGTTTAAYLRSGESVKEAIAWICTSSAETVMFNCSSPEVMDSALSDAKCVLSQQKRNVLLGVYANAFEHSPTPRVANEDIARTRADLDIKSYSKFAQQWAANGASIIGGCCGIGCDYIAQLVKDLQK